MLRPDTQADLMGTNNGVSKVRIDSPGPGISAEDVRKLETIIGFSLPHEYRDFLLKFNGGQPIPYGIDIDGFDESPTDVQVFFGINRKEKTSNIEWNLAEFSKHVVGIGIPVACDSGGAIFVLRPDGRVLYLLPFDESASAFITADSFSSFLSALS